MRKNILYLISFLFLMIVFFPVNIKAVTIKDVSCKYTMQTPNSVNIGTLEVQMINYNDGTGSPRIVLFNSDKNNELKLNNNSRDNYDFYNSDDKLYGSVSLNINIDNDFVNAFKRDKKCPPVYVNSDPNGGAIRVSEAIESPDYKTTYKQATHTQTYFRGETGGWLLESNFIKNNTTSSTQSQTQSKDKDPCKYNITLEATGDTTFSYYTKSNYSGDPVYYISVGGRTEVVDLKSSVDILVGSGTGASLYISQSQLQKMFNSDKCLPKDDLFSYLNGATADAGQHKLTTDKEEAMENGIGGRYYDTTGSMYVGDGKVEELQFSESQSCEQLLGDNGTKLVKVGIVALRIITPILLLVLTARDFMMAVPAQDEDAMMKAWKTFGKRGIVAVLIIILPTLINMLGTLFGIFDGCSIW